ncbi:hypothetical protein [Pseudonocardia sp. GCM10023141]|uniref:hypothetical protein n=1 Tax=Pseudonocardia sp. GCM10023141 TaxID=3252653 RepID=UPI0036096BFD
MTTTEATLDFLTPEWAAAARDAVNRGPAEELKESKLPTYWEWIDNARARYSSSWALADLGRPGETLLLEWSEGQCVRATVVGDAEAAGATYLLTAKHDVWRQLFDGADAGRLLMCRDIELRRGNVLQFYRAVYFVVESLAELGRVPTRIS